MKANQPTLYADIRDAFQARLKILDQNGGAIPKWQKKEWEQEGVVWSQSRETTKGHGRREVRQAWACSDPELNRYLGSAGVRAEAWPGVAQIVRIERERILKGEASKEEVFLVTSQPPQEVRAKDLLEQNRAYWGIENGLHHVRDVTMEEDRSQIRSGAAPQVMAGLRNLTLTLLHRSGAANIAAKLRTFAARPKAAVDLVLSPPLSQ